MSHKFRYFFIITDQVPGLTVVVASSEAVGEAKGASPPSFNRNDLFFMTFNCIKV